MALAINDAGDVLTDASGKWMPASRAVNDTTGETLVHDGDAWKPVAALKAAPATDTAPAPDQAAPAATPSLTAYAGTVDTDAPASVSLPSPTDMRDKLQQADMSALTALQPDPHAGIAERVGHRVAQLGVHTLAGIASMPLNAMIGVGQGPGGAVTINPETNTLGLTPEASAAAGFAASPLRFGGAAVVPPTITAREVQARDGVSIMEAWRRAHAENRAPVKTVADIGNAPDIGSAIEAAGEVAKMPADDIPTVTVTASAPEMPAAGAQPVGAEITNPALIPGLSAEQRAAAQRALADQQAAGGGGLPGGLPEPTPAQKATALQKMVNQSAEDRLTPQGRDDNVYVEGVARPESMRDFSPAEEGAVSAALAHKTDYYMDSNYRGRHDAIVKENNNVMKDHLDGLIQDANARDAAMNEARELMPGPTGLFDGERPVDAQPIVDTINGILSGPANKRGAVRTMLNGILDNLNDANGNLENLPSMLKGVRDDITDKLYDKSPTVEGNAARTASNQLRTVLSVVDDTIASGLPGTRYQDYLTNLSEALGKVSKLDFLQKYITGSKKLTDLSGNLLFNKVQGLLNDIQAHHADRTGGAKELTMSEINQIEAVRNELAAKDLLDRRSKVPGSPTAQIQNAAGILGSGPLGAAVKGGAELALHAGLAATTGGLGNAALGGYRFIVRPAMDAARLQQEAAIAAARRARLLDTTPRPEAAP